MKSPMCASRSVVLSPLKNAAGSFKSKTKSAPCTQAKTKQTNKNPNRFAERKILSILPLWRPET